MRATIPLLAMILLGTSLTSLAATNGADGGTVRVSELYVGGNSSTETTAIAKTHDLVVLGTGAGTSGPSAVFYQANPNIKVVEYQSWFDTGPGSPEWSTINAHESWFYHDANGYRIATYGTAKNANCVPSQCPANASLCSCRFGMNLGEPGYQNFVAARLTDFVTPGGSLGGTHGFDGVFLDNTFPSWPYRPSKVSSGSVTATPLNAATHVTQTEADWDHDQLAFVQLMKNAVGTGKLLLFNGCSTSSSTSLWQNNSYALLQYADGCTMEDWSVSGTGTSAVPVTGATLTRNLVLFKGVNDRGKWSLPLVGNGIHTAPVNRYGIVASFLVWSGPLTTMNFWKGTAQAAVAGTFKSTFPEAFVDLGTPLETYQTLTGGALSRKFSLGRVVLNPTGTNQVIPLAGTMHTIEGAPLNSITLAPGHAEILLF